MALQLRLQELQEKEGSHCQAAWGEEVAGRESQSGRAYERGGECSLCMLPTGPFCRYCVFVSWLQRPCACRMYVNVCVAYFRLWVCVNCWLWEMGLYCWKDFAVRVFVCGCVVCVTDFLPNALFRFQLWKFSGSLAEWVKTQQSQKEIRGQHQMEIKREGVARREKKKEIWRKGKRENRR